MISYRSTRSDGASVFFPQTVLAGLASDGGLFVPERLPVISPEWLDACRDLGYQEIAARVLGLFETDLSEEVIRQCVRDAYGNAWDHESIAPVVALDAQTSVLELWHGPTCAFKDLALQLMPRLFVQANRLSSSGSEQQLRHLIIVATSGDTGKAALAGYQDVEGVDISVYFPSQGVSPIQELAMRTQEGSNVLIKGMQGDFDTVQSAIKSVFSDQVFASYLRDRYQVQLSSANSINWGRLLPQIVYYVSGYIDLIEQRGLHIGDQVDVVVPSGNFGNLLAAYLAKRMGMPLGRLVCASNQNNVLTKFLLTGLYDIRTRSLARTCSPSMDILIASNIERLLWFVCSDPARVASWMAQLKATGCFQIDARTMQTIQQDFSAYWTDDAGALDLIKTTWNDHDYMVDPHTAVALSVADQYRLQYRSSRPLLIASTAHWAKFPGAVLKAIDEQSMRGFVEGQDEFAMLKRIEELTDVLTPERIRKLSDLPVRFASTVRADVLELKHGVEYYLGARYGKRGQ